MRWRRPERAPLPRRSCQIDDSVFGEGGAAFDCDDRVDDRVGEPAQVVALPVATVLAERRLGVEELLQIAIVHLA